MRRIIILYLFFFALITPSYTQERAHHDFVVIPIAFDRFASVVSSPREPYELLIAENVTANERPGPLIRIVVFPETTGRRGGVKPLDESALRQLQQWAFKGRIATKTENATICRAYSYFNAADGSIDTNEKGEPEIRFRSVRYDGFIVFASLATTTCVISESVPVLPKMRPTPNRKT
jgi:hypothetical protein